MNFRNRFPSLAQLAPVYAVAVVILYAWALLRFSWRLPSLIKYSTPGEIFVTFSYMTTVNFIESLIVIAAPLVLCFILPQKWFHENFIAKGVLLVLGGLGYATYISLTVEEDVPFTYDLFRQMPIILLVILLVSILLGQVKFVSKLLEDLADRFVIFLYISLPVSIIAVLVVLFRNIF